MHAFFRCFWTLFLLERHGDVWVWLRAAGEVWLQPEEAVLQQLPLSVGDIVLQVHVVCPVRHVNLHTGTVVNSVLFIVSLKLYQFNFYPIYTRMQNHTPKTESLLLKKQINYYYFSEKFFVVLFLISNEMFLIPLLMESVWLLYRIFKRNKLALLSGEAQKKIAYSYLKVT